jgi:enamine deaminase RidA (YjgF/YER057c/UK114 family)
MFSTINPESLGAPKGFSNGMLAAAGGRLLFVAGQVGWDAQGQFVGSGFVEQFDKALDNALEVVRAAGGCPENVGRMTIYVTDKAEYSECQREVGRCYRERMGRHFPAMALVEVKSLLEPLAKVEIEVTAVL